MVGETDLDASLRAADCVVIAADHSAYNWGEIAAKANPLVDAARRALTAQQREIARNHECCSDRLRILGQKPGAES